MIQGFGQEITEIPAFGHDITEVRAMGQLVWQKQSSIPDYLCFTALEAGQFTLTIPAAVTPTYLSYIEWSKDGRTWNHTDNTSEAVTIDVQVASGEKVYWRGSGSRMAYDYSVNKYSVFSSTGTFDVSGDLRSLLFADDFENVTTTNQQYCFTGLFYGASVVDASNLRLALTGLGAYMYCFRGCTQLLHAPALMEGNTIMQWQFHSTYQDCTNLITGTDLQATSVGVRGFYYTYRSCTSLVKAPNISSITTIGNSGLCAMFWGCTSLTYIKCLATSLYDDGDASHFATSNWLVGASSTGTFIQASGVTWPRGASGIPTGWVAIEKRTMPSGYKQVLGIKRTSSAYGIDIGHAYNVKYSRLEVAFKQDEISNGMVLQTKDSIAGKVWLYNYQGSSLAKKPFSFYTSNASNTQRGGTIYSPLDTNPHTVEVSSDGSRGTLKHDGITTTASFNLTDLPESCTSNPYLFGYNFYYYGWIYYFKEWDSSDVALSDFVSCIRENDNVVGFYDFVSQTFKTAANTSAFTAGEEI